MEEEEYEKQRLALGLDDEMNMWLEQHQIVAICPSEPISFGIFFFVFFVNEHVCVLYAFMCMCAFVKFKRITDFFFIDLFSDDLQIVILMNKCA